MSMLKQKEALNANNRESTVQLSNVSDQNSKHAQENMTEHVELPTYHSILYHSDSFHHYESEAEAHLHRAILYRLHFKIITLDTFSEWGNVFQKLNDDYQELKIASHDSLITSKYFEQVAAYQLLKNQKCNIAVSQSPVSVDVEATNVDNQISTPNTNCTDTKQEPKLASKETIFDIHSDVIARQLILKDMERLFMNGIDNTYFQTEHRRVLLQNVICMWCCSSIKLSSYWGGYKQGMHEIAAVVLFVVENEFECYKKFKTTSKSLNVNEVGDDDSSSAVDVSWFSDHEDHLEMHTYYLFDKIMTALRVAYSVGVDDSVSTAGAAGGDSAGADSGCEDSVEPMTMSAFLVYIQDVVVKSLHPRLWEHLKICGIDPQLYGTSWSRLLFGRALLTTHAEQLTLWDYLFAPAIKDFPKLPFVKHNIPQGPYGSTFLGVEAAGVGVKCNQFGVTDTTLDYHRTAEGLAALKLQRSMSGSDDVDDDSSTGSGKGGWTGQSQWLPGFSKKKSPISEGVAACSSDGRGDESDGINSSHLSRGLHLRQVAAEVINKGGVDDGVGDGGGDDDHTKISDTADDVNTADDANPDQNSDFRDPWRDSGPISSADTAMQQERTAAAITRNSKDNDVDYDNDDDDEDEDEDEDEKYDLFDAEPYMTSDDHDDVGNDDDDADDDSVVEWPFAGEELLMKIGCISLAIIFKMRETILASSELGTITTLLRPFEKVRESSKGGSLDEFVFELIRLSQQFESCVVSQCAVQPIPLHAISDLMDFHNIRSATYSLDIIGAPTWRDASVYIKPGVLAKGFPLGHDIGGSTALSSNIEDTSRFKGWFLGKYLGKFVSGRSKSEVTNDCDDSIESKMKKKRLLLVDYYSACAAAEGLSAEFSMLSDLPLHMGWLRKRKPSGPMINYNKWKRRFIVLTRDSLSYYTNDTFDERRGQFFLSSSTCALVEDGTTEKHRLKFVLEDPQSKQKVRFFLVDSDEARQLWVKRINQAVGMLRLAEHDCLMDSMLTASSTSSSPDKGSSDRNRNSSSNTIDPHSSDEDEKVFEFSVGTDFCRNELVGDDLQTYHYASGWLKKKNLIGGGWRLLFFELVKEEILFYTETTNVAAKSPLGRIQISANTVVLNRSQGKTKYKFAIATSTAVSASPKRKPFQNIFSSSTSSTDVSRNSDSALVTAGATGGGGIIGKKVIYIAASNAVEKEQWMAVLRDAIAMLKNRSAPTSPTTRS